MMYKRIWGKLLTKDEKVEYEFSIGKGFRKFGLIAGTIASIFLLKFFGIGILVFLATLFYYAFYLKAANAYAFTNERVIVKRGWLSTTAISIPYEKITDVTAHEPLFDRLITRTGHLTINTAGTSVAEVVLTHITKPYEVKKKLDEFREKSDSSL